MKWQNCIREKRRVNIIELKSCNIRSQTTYRVPRNLETKSGAQEINWKTLAQEFVVLQGLPTAARSKDYYIIFHRCLLDMGERGLLTFLSRGFLFFFLTVLVFCDLPLAYLTWVKCGFNRWACSRTWCHCGEDLVWLWGRTLCDWGYSRTLWLCVNTCNASHDMHFLLTRLKINYCLKGQSEKRKGKNRIWFVFRKKFLTPPSNCKVMV